MVAVRLRELRDDDADAVFEMMRDPVAVAMAAFTVPDPDDRAAFDGKFRRQREDPDIREFAVEADGRFVGTAAVYGAPDEREVTYWIDRSAWGRGIASQALGLLLEAVPDRPLLGGAATENLASLAVLRRHGFQEIGRDRAFAAGAGREVEEVRMRLEA